MKMNGEDLSVLKEKKTKKTLLKIITIFIIIVTIFFLSENNQTNAYSVGIILTTSFFK